MAIQYTSIYYISYVRQIASFHVSKQFVVLLVFFSCTLFSFFPNTAFAQTKSEPSLLSHNQEDSRVVLTPEEQDWLAAHPNIVLGYTDAFEPEVVVNPDGSHSGILVDFLEELNRRLGTSITIGIDSIPGILQKAKTKEVDGILEMHPEYADKLGLLKSIGYLRDYPAVFARKDVSFAGPEDFAGRKIAIIDKVYFTEKMVREYGEQATILRVKDAIQGMKSVSEGEADLYIGVSFNSYYITKYQLFDVVAKYIFRDFPDKFGMAVRPDWPELVPILNKGISSFSQNDIDTIVAKWIHLPQQEKTVELTSVEQAWLKNHPIITLGGGNFAPLDFFDKTKGQSDGVGPDYAKLIGSMLGVEFKLVSGDWQEILDMAKSKKIDGTRLIFKSKEREKYLNYTKPFVKIAHAIVMKKETKGGPSLKELSHKRVGTLKGIYAYHYMKEHYPDLDIITYPTWEKVLRAVVNNEVEAVVGTLPVLTYMINKLFITNLKVVALPTEMERNAYLGIRPDWPELTVIINKAIDAITIKQHSEIKKKWVALNTEDKEIEISFTQEEQAWFSENHNVRLRAVDWPPYMIINENGPPQGIAVEYLKLIEERTGINFEYEVTNQPFAEFLESIKQRQGPDMALLIIHTPDREEYLSFTAPYISSPYVIFAREKEELLLDIGGLVGKAVAIPRGFVMQELLERDYPAIRLVLFDNDEQALFAVSTGKVDVYIGNLTVASHIIQMRGLSNLRVVGSTPYGDQMLSMGNRSDWPELTSITNKAFASITEEEKTAIRNKYVALRYEQGINRAVVLKWILIFVGIAIGILLLFVFWNWQLRRKVRVRTAALEAEIVERANAEESLRDSEEKFRYLMEQSPLSMQIFNLDGQIIQVNEAWLELWGISEEDLSEVFEKYNILEDEEVRKFGIMPLIEKAFKGEVVTLPVIEYDAPSTMENLEIGHVKANKRWIQARLYPIRNSKGEVVNIVDIEEDITVSKVAEEKILDHQQRLKALASQLTIAEEKERSRIAADLHDHIGQTLAFSRIQVAKAKKYASEEKLANILDEISQSLLKTIQDTKDLVFDLSSPLLNELGLHSAILHWLEENVSRKHGIEFELVGEKVIFPLSKDVRAILFRNVRELLTNVIRHAQAKKIIVSVVENETELKIVVSDDGTGFDIQELKEKEDSMKKFGLFSIRERMEDMGGLLEMVSEPGRGCKAILSTPLDSGGETLERGS